MTVLAAVAPARATPSFTNGSFETLNGETTDFAINYFGSGVNVLPGWTATPTGTTGSGASNVLDCLIIGTKGNTDLCGSGASAPFTPAVGAGMNFWPGTFQTAKDGANYVMIDADPTFETALTQSVSSLVIGHSYQISFFQATAQQNTFSFVGNDANTTNNGLACGATGLLARCIDFTVGFGSSTHASPNMVLNNHSSTAWVQQTMTFVATATTQTLSFLAVADVPANSGMPPIALLDGITLTDVTPTPEPGTFALLGLGLVAIPLLLRYRR